MMKNDEKDETINSEKYSNVLDQLNRRNSEKGSGSETKFFFIKIINRLLKCL